MSYNLRQITKPTILTEPLMDLDVGSTENPSVKNAAFNLDPSKAYGYFFPVVSFDGRILAPNEIRDFELSLTGFIPTIKFFFTDLTGKYVSRNVNADSLVISVFIQGPYDKNTYKPIRMDFTVDRMIPQGNEMPGVVAMSTYFVNGTAKIPNLFRDTTFFNTGTSFDTFMKISKVLGLGFSTNVENTQDEMTYINSNDTMIKFCNDVAQTVYLDDKSYFNIFVDPYYCLTLVEYQRMFDAPVNEVEASLEFIVNNPSAFEKSILPEETMQNSVAFLTNLLQYAAKSNFIQSYIPYNNSAQIVKNEGYRRFNQYYDVSTKSFVSEYIDPIVSEDKNKINLRPRTIREDGKLKAEYEMKQGSGNVPYKMKYLGKKGVNSHPQMEYAVIQNRMNGSEMKKMGATVKLNGFNPALYRGQRVYLMMFDQTQLEKDQQGAYDENMDKGVAGPGEKPIETKYPDQQRGNLKSEGYAPMFNENQSGFYIIDSIKYLWNTLDLPVSMEINLIRKDMSPPTTTFR